jgi:hypothetical protein
MIRQLARRAAVAAVPLITLPVLVLAAAPGTALASAPSASLQFLGQAQLQSDGSVVVTLDYSCMPGTPGAAGWLQATVSQSGTTAGLNYFEQISVTCDGHKHIVSVDVPVESGPGFTKGPASAVADVSNDTGGSVAQVYPPVKLKIT